MKTNKRDEILGIVRNGMGTRAMLLMEPKISHQIHFISNPFFVISHLTKSYAPFIRVRILQKKLPKAK